jgi:protein phosphatase
MKLKSDNNLRKKSWNHLRDKSIGSGASLPPIVSSGAPSAGNEASLSANCQQGSASAGDDVVTLRAERIESYCEVVTAADSHVGTRDYQQDSLYVSDTACFAQGAEAKTLGIVCDGMGGLKSGSEVSQRVLGYMVQALDDIGTIDDLAKYIRNHIRDLDAEIADEYGAGKAGTTMVLALLLGSQLYWASVGDSRIYLLRGGEIAQVTRDHNLRLLLEREVAEGRMPAGEVEEHEQKEALISYIGSGEVELIDIGRNPIKLLSGDIVLLCSDGLTKSLSDDEINAVIAEHYGDIRETSRLLPLIAFDTGGSKDNTSVVLIQYFE